MTTTKLGLLSRLCKVAADISDFKTYFQVLSHHEFMAGRQQIEKGQQSQPLSTTAAAGNSSCCLFGSRDLREFATGLSPQITIQFSLCFPFLVAC